MNILIINHYAGNPKLGMEYRPFYLAREWVKQGHSVTILGASYSHLRTLQPIVNNDFSEDNIEGISYLWLKTPKYKGNIERIMNILVFVFKLIRYANKIAKKISPDLVIASSTYPLDIIPSKKIAKKSKAKLCFEVHDLWPLSPMVIGGYSKFHPYICLLQFAENYAYKHADIVISLLGNAREYMNKHGLDSNKFVHVPNGFDREEFEKMQEDVPYEHFKLISDLKTDGNILIGYTGGHGPSNAMNVFVDAAEMFKDNKRISFISIGNGPSKTELQTRAKNLNNIFFLPPVPKKSIPKLLSLFDILYVGFVKSEIHKHGISPNKLIDYMLAAKPIILSANVKDETVEKCNCGIVVPAEDLLAVYYAINKFIRMTDIERIEIGDRGKKYAIKEFDYQILADKFLKKIIETN